MGNERIYCFDPLIDNNSKFVIIGTLPGRKSLIRKQYYADENNLFWDIIYRVIDHDKFKSKLVQEEFDYTTRCKFILAHKIGLWDILSSAKRQNSSDSKIYDERYNDFPKFLKGYPSVTKLIFNGAKAFKYFKKIYPQILQQNNYSKVYSTSPQNSINSFRILLQWQDEIK